MEEGKKVFRMVPIVDPPSAEYLAKKKGAPPKLSQKHGSHIHLGKVDIELPEDMDLQLSKRQKYGVAAVFLILVYFLFSGASAQQAELDKTEITRFVNHYANEWDVLHELTHPELAPDPKLDGFWNLYTPDAVITFMAPAPGDRHVEYEPKPGEHDAMPFAHTEWAPYHGLVAINLEQFKAIMLKGKVAQLKGGVRTYHLTSNVFIEELSYSHAVVTAYLLVTQSTHDSTSSPEPLFDRFTLKKVFLCPPVLAWLNCAQWRIVKQEAFFMAMEAPMVS